MCNISFTCLSMLACFHILTFPYLPARLWTNFRFNFYLPVFHFHISNLTLIIYLPFSLLLAASIWTIWAYPCLASLSLSLSLSLALSTNLSFYLPVSPSKTLQCVSMHLRRLKHRKVKLKAQWRKVKLKTQWRKVKLACRLSVWPSVDPRCPPCRSPKHRVPSFNDHNGNNDTTYTYNITMIKTIEMKSSCYLSPGLVTSTEHFWVQSYLRISNLKLLTKLSFTPPWLLSLSPKGSLSPPWLFMIVIFLLWCLVYCATVHIVDSL